MKTLKLLRLALDYFKGAISFVLDAEGKEVRVYGTNEAGKTTLFDAFLWLFFHKDSQNKADFGIKTLQNGKEMHNMEHSVEGSFLIDGRRRTFKKVFKEVWSKKRGSASTEFSGHTTDYFVDGVPVSKKEYDEEVKCIVSEDVFKLLTNPFYFHEHMHWSERLKVLLQVCGDVSDAEVIAGTKSLQGLEQILDGRSIEQHRKMVTARQSKINEELKDIPVRISEANRSMPELPQGGRDYFAGRIESLRGQISDKQEEIARIQSGGEVTVKQNRIREIEGELLQLKNQLQGDVLETVIARRRTLSRIQQVIEDIRHDIDVKKSRIGRNERTIEQLEADRNDLRTRYNIRNAETFNPHHDDNCAACGQALPAERIAETHRRAEEAFNLSKSRDLEAIQTKGIAVKTESEKLQAEKSQLERELEQLYDRLEAEHTALESAKRMLEEAESQVTDVESHPEYIAKRSEIAGIKAEIESLQQSTSQAVAEVRGEINDLQNSIRELEHERAKFDLAESIQKRIAELEQQEKDLASEYERLAHELYLTEEFTRAKTAMMEDRINSKFKLARFKLYKEQVNGGLEATCVATYKGVPFDAGLNNAARINVGLDVIRTLSKHYKISVPIFVDNAESVVDLTRIESQMILLIVSERDRQLRVEVESIDDAKAS
jgi:Chromosome segregation ATPases